MAYEIDFNSWTESEEEEEKTEDSDIDIEEPKTPNADNEEPTDEIE